MLVSEHVSADRASDIGENILKLMEGHVVSDYTFFWKNQIHNLATEKAASVKVGKKEVEGDPNLLFQSFAIAGQNTGDLEDALCYEMCSFPPALFENPFVFCLGQKSAQMNPIASKVTGDHYKAKPPENAKVAFDGGA